MRFLENISIRWKLTLIMAVVSSAAAVLALSAFVLHDLTVARESMEERLTTLSQVISANCTAAVAFDDEAAAQEILNSLDATPHVLFAGVYRPDGTPLVIRDPGSMSFGPGAADLRNTGTRFGDLYMTACQDIVLDGERVGTLYLVSDQREYEQRLRQYLATTSAIAAAAIAISLVLSWALQHVVARPLLALTDVARKVSQEGDYTVRATGSSADEVGVLIGSFNEMLNQIQQRDAELAEHGQRLEDLVAKRTAELTQTNEDLRAEMVERKRMEEERTHLEAQIQQAQKLESLGVLAGGIAHDFNNLLMGILGNAELASLDLCDDSPARDCVDGIQSAAKRAADLAKQMLAYSGKGKFVIERINLNVLVREMAHLLQASVSKKADVRYDLAGDLPPIQADTTQIRQILMNLIINASEAIEGGEGSVTVRTSLRAYEDQQLNATYLQDDLPAGDYVCLEVSDTGCGMDTETVTKVFDPFFTTKFTGRGLGLAAVLGIVRGHRGAVDVRSAAGEGTTFTVLLPVAEGEADAILESQTTIETTKFRSSGTVLVVDDEATVRIVAEKMLRRLGFDVLLATDGQEGVDLFQEQSARIRAVLLDLTMPRLDGEQALAEMRRHCPDIPVILSSGYTEQEATERFAGRGLAGFIQKPYRSATLAQQLDRALNG